MVEGTQRYREVVTSPKISADKVVSITTRPVKSRPVTHIVYLACHARAVRDRVESSRLGLRRAASAVAGLHALAGWLDAGGSG